MYILMRMLSILIRVFVLSSPFGNPVYDFLAEGPLHFVTFGVVGLMYEKDSAPALGSFLYLLFYWVHTLLIALLSRYSFSRAVVVVVCVPYLALLLFFYVRDPFRARL